MKKKKAETPKPLQREFRRHGFSYRQRRRIGNAAIYEQNAPGWPSPNYEVIAIRSCRGHPKSRFAGQLVERYPSNTEWGVYGFTYGGGKPDTDLWSMALRKLKAISAGPPQKQRI